MWLNLDLVVGGRTSFPSVEQIFSEANSVKEFVIVDYR
jgi:hypothetical protein